MSPDAMLEAVLIDLSRYQRKALERTAPMYNASDIDSAISAHAARSVTGSLYGPRSAPPAPRKPRAPKPLKTYRLGSAGFVHAPGLVRWAINGAAFKRDRAKMARVISETWSIPSAAALALVAGVVSYTLEDSPEHGPESVVVFTA